MNTLHVLGCLFMATVFSAMSCFSMQADPQLPFVYDLKPNQYVNGITLGERASLTVHCDLLGLYYNSFVPVYGHPRYRPKHIGRIVFAQRYGWEVELVCAN